MKPKIEVLLGLGLALCLAACGKVGQLATPPPLIGEKAKADYQAKMAAEAAEKAAKAKAQNEPTANPNAVADQPDPTLDNRPKTTRDIQDPNQKLTPLRASPVDGSPNPFGGPVSVTPPNP